MQEKAQEYPNVEVRYVTGALPTLTLDYGNSEEVVNIANWDVHVIEAFLGEKVQK